MLSCSLDVKLVSRMVFTFNRYHYDCVFLIGKTMIISSIPDRVYFRDNFLILFPHLVFVVYVYIMACIHHG